MKFRYLLLVGSVPLLLFLSMAQSYRHYIVRQEILKLEKNQKEIIEENKKIIMGNAILSSPERLENLATGELGLEKITSKNVKKVEFDGLLGGETRL